MEADINSKFWEDFYKIPSEYSNCKPARKFPEFNKCLVIHGVFGCGKTHGMFQLMKKHALNIADKSKDPKARLSAICNNFSWWRATNAADRLNELGMDMNYVEVDNLYNSKLLFLDDIGRNSLAPWVKARLADLIEHRYMHSLKTIWTSRYGLGELSEYFDSGAISDRLRDFSYIEIKAESRRSVNYSSKTVKKGDI